MFRAKAMNIFVEFMASAVAAWKRSSPSAVVNGVVKIYVVHGLATSQLHLLKADMLFENRSWSYRSVYSFSRENSMQMKTTSKRNSWSVAFCLYRFL